MVSFHCVLLVFIARPVRWPNPAKINYVHYDRDFVEAISFSFDPPPRACTDQENCCQAVHGEEA